ncbi:MAG: glutamate--tRNA ligase [Bacilli bacterium]|nr:glutamate--tRNA ligase [Bacilli bacterium]
MNLKEELANLIFPNIKETIEDLEKKYPERDLKEGAKVTRFAPSPTGFLHTGSLFTSMIASKIAKDTEGIFYTRLEDTDTKREIEGSDKLLLKQLKEFGIVPNEGYFGDHEEGIYGPYVQSKRKEIYETVIKELLIRGDAYPCFLSAQDLEELREEQTKNKEITGVYGKYAKYRDLDEATAISWIKEGKPYVIRFKSRGNHENKIKVHDEIKGDLLLTENDQDVVILKSDGLPTYHFAHVVDDHFMHTNLVTRGEEWLASLPIHVEMFRVLGFKAPKYAHLPVIMKLDNGNKRKLSKRKDPEASVDYFLSQGFEPNSLLVYLMTIANSNYEEFIVQSKDYDLDHFKFSLKKMSLDGALFDNDKLAFYAKEILSKMKKEEIAAKSYAWAKEFSPELKAFIEEDYSRYEEILNIDREKKNPRKDYAKYADIYPVIKFFKHDEFLEILKSPLEFNENISKEIIKEFLKAYLGNYALEADENAWFQNVKEIAVKFNFCADNKLYKEDPSKWSGNINDACEIIRLAIVGRKVTPNLFAIMKILPKEEIDFRIESVISTIN